MRMIRNNKDGVTLIALVATVIVLAILLGVSIHYGLTGTKNIKNKKMESELSIVQEAVMQRYALVKAQKGLGLLATPIVDNTALVDDPGRPEGFVGTRLATSMAVWSNGFQNIKLMVNYPLGSSDKTYEEYYYLLNEYDLSLLGISKRRNIALHRTYIVNYSTGEIFDVANRTYNITKTQNADPVYTQPSFMMNTVNNAVTNSVKSYDFNDD